MKNWFFNSMQRCTSPEMLKMWIHGCRTGCLKTITTLHQPLNCFVLYHSVLPLKKLAASTVNLSSHIITCKCWWSLWNQVRHHEQHSSWRNCYTCPELSIEFLRGQSVPSKAMTHLMRKLLASWRIWYSTSFMAFLSTITISSWGLWQMLLFLRLNWSLTLPRSWNSSD